MKFEAAILIAQEVCAKLSHVAITRKSNAVKIYYYDDIKSIWSPIEEGIKVSDIVADDWEVSTAYD